VATHLELSKWVKASYAILIIIIISYLRYYHSVKTPVQTIVFSDLKVEGYKVASREAGLDWNHASLILQQLGKFHATSMVLAKKVGMTIME